MTQTLDNPIAETTAQLSQRLDGSLEQPALNNPIAEASGQLAQVLDSELVQAIDSGVGPFEQELAAPGLLIRLLEWLEVGGPVVAILLAMSVLALTLVFAKLLQFRALHIGRRNLGREALAVWKSGDKDRALELASGSRNPATQALARAMRGRIRQLPERQIREEVLRYGGDLLFGLRRGLRPLEVIGSLAPLLGLLGTVLGMIKAFQQLEAAGNQVNPAVLSGGIWEALMTTAVGLCVAIPVVALLNWLERRVDHLAHDMDNLVTQIFTPDLSEQAVPGDQAAPAKTESQASSSHPSQSDQAHVKPRKLQPA